MEQINHNALLDTLSEMLFWEQGEQELYRTCAERAQDNELKSTYQKWAKEEENHKKLLVQLIQKLGGDPSYVSLLGRSAQVGQTMHIQSYLYVDGMLPEEIEKSDFNDLHMSEDINHGNWASLQATAQQMGEGQIGKDLLDQIKQVEQDEDQRVAWYHQKNKELSSHWVTQERALSADRWQQDISGPTPPIDQIHPSPMTEGLLEPAKRNPWIKSPPVR